MRIIVCGSRDWWDRQTMAVVLHGIHRSSGGDLTIIEGCAPGADALAETFISWTGVGIEHYPADWERYGPSAGPRRNATMLEAKPELVVAFKDEFGEHLTKRGNEGGTENMVRIAQDAGIETRVVSH